MRRVVHLGLDVRVQVCIAQPLESLVPIHIFLLRSTDDSTSDVDRDVTNPVKRRIEPILGPLILSQRLRKTYSRSIDHLLGDVDRFAENGAKTDPWENIHVVALAGVVGNAVSLDFREGGARSEEGLVVGVLHGLFECALRLAGGVRQREYDGAVVEGAHLTKDGFGEYAANGTETHEDSRANVIHNLLKGLELLALVIVAGKVDFVLL